uniref:Guanine-nucleotide binding protein n=1 Tax=Solanum tuberosum TaxID=4113 RepID=M1E011_SOLTU
MDHPFLHNHTLGLLYVRQEKHTFFNISEDRSYKRSIHELCNAIIRASAQEWLVLEDFDSTDCYLWNPISNDKIQLPPLPYNDNLECLLSAPPNDPQCRAFFLIHETTPPDDDDEEEDESSNDDVHNETTPPNDDIDTNDNENPDDYTDTNDDDTDNENPEDDHDDDNSDEL